MTPPFKSEYSEHDAFYARGGTCALNSGTGTA